MQDNIDDICTYRRARYLKERDGHTERGVDVLRLLCLTEIVDYGLKDTLSGEAGAITTAVDINAGEVITFYPADAATATSATSANTTARLFSDRHRATQPAGIPPGAGLKLVGGVYIYGNMDLREPNYMGHLIATGPAGNCAIEATETAVKVVATREIHTGEVLCIIQT